MSFRGWAGSIATAVGVAAGAGAAQLGVGYGLGVFSWLPTVHGADEAAWLASLAWTVWIAAFSVVLGAVVADRTGSASIVDRSTATRILWRVVLASAAALGGLLVVALTAVPARVAQRADTFAPQLIVGGYAIAGVLLGLFVAIAAIAVRAVAANLLATGAWLWLLATVATVDGLAAGRDLGVSQLGAWTITGDGPWFNGSLYLPGAAVAGGSALLIGALAALPAARAGAGPVGLALSGAAGPALVAAAYLLAAPELGTVDPQQLSAHLVAPYAVLTGLVGSVLVVLLTRPRRSRFSDALDSHVPLVDPVTVSGSEAGPVSADPVSAQPSEAANPVAEPAAKADPADRSTTPKIPAQPAGAMDDADPLSGQVAAPRPGRPGRSNRQGRAGGKSGDTA